MQPARGLWVIFVTFLVALMFSIISLPQSWSLWRPDWITMVLIYWVMALPHRVGILAGWCAGLFMDVATGQLLGLSGILLACIAYFTIVSHQRLRIFPTWQQASFVAFIVAIKLLIMLIVINSVAPVERGVSHWFPVISSALMWPVVFPVLRYLRRYYAVN